ncbi:MAG: alpha/beta fold hydrolase [Pyrinomonadaceae bacterium]|nr:alpha/beta fold hydrolase [Pyrinomonadaceae bacterium]
MINKIFASFLILLTFSVAAFAQIAPQEKSAVIFGAKIHYVEAGDAKNPKVVLLHGLGASITSWQLNIVALSQKYHVIALDQVGFGKSDKPMLKYRVGTYTDFLDKFLSELKIEKASLIGNSLGGWIAADFALKYPAKVEKIVLADAAGLKPNLVDFNRIYALNFSTRDEIRALVKLVFYNQTLFGSEAFVDESLRLRVAAGDGYTINSLIDSIKREEDFLNGRLGGIKQPTLIVWGKQDGLLPLADGEKFDKEIPNFELIVFDRCGHVPQVEKAADFNKQVLEFLAKK